MNADVSLLTSLELSLSVVSTCAIARHNKEIVSLIWLQLRSGLTELEPGLGNELDVATLRTPEVFGILLSGLVMFDDGGDECLLN